MLFLTLVCSIVAYLMLNYAFRFLPAGRVSVFINLTPIVAVASAYVAAGRAADRGAGGGRGRGGGGRVADEQRGARGGRGDRA